MPAKKTAATSIKEVFYTPRQIADSRQVDVMKVLHWINTGELVAVNYAKSTLGPPRWKVSATALAEFEKARQPTPPPERKTTSRTDDSLPAVKNYFP